MLISKNDLIKKLNEIEGNPIVVLLDYKKNIASDDGDGSSDGIYPNFEIEVRENLSSDDENSEDFIICLTFDNLEE